MTDIFDFDDVNVANALSDSEIVRVGGVLVGRIDEVPIRLTSVVTLELPLALAEEEGDCDVEID